MLKTYQKYILINFLLKFFLITLIFFLLIFILGSLEEISFFKDLDVNFFYPYFLTFLNSPVTLFEIFPFIFFLSSQFLFFDLIKKNELNLLKTNGLKNTSLLKDIFLFSLLIGIFNIIVFYNFASNLKFYYSDIKNSYSNDNKYLAMITQSGLWIKDENNDQKMIINSELIKDNHIYNVIINIFNNNFELVEIIQSEKVDIKSENWIIHNPKITSSNVTYFENNNIYLKTHFNYQKILNLFSNIYTLNILKLLDLKKDYENLGYSSDEITIHLLKLLTTPFLCGVMSLLSATIMLSINRNSSFIFYIGVGFVVSVLIYYLIFFFTSLGNSGKIPVILSIVFPLSILSILSIIGIININEK